MPVSGLHTKILHNDEHLILWQVFVEAMELIKPSVKIVDCELFSHIYFATLPIHRSCAYLDSLGKFFFFGSKSGFIKGVGPSSGL